jgi:biopolymer transport protein ExbB/TolQ
MKKLAMSIALLLTASSVFAACPAYAPYNCVQGYNGKMICGCGVR